MIRRAGRSQQPASAGSAGHSDPSRPGAEAHRILLSCAALSGGIEEMWPRPDRNGSRLGRSGDRWCHQAFELDSDEARGTDSVGEGSR